LKRIVLAIFPFILSACATSQPENNIDITRSKEGSDHNVISIRLDAPLNKPVTFDNMKTTRYVSEVVVEDGKSLSKSFSQLSDGTTVWAIARDKGNGEQLVSLTVRHACPPEMREFPSGGKDGIEIPGQKVVQTKQKILIKRGEDILITGSGFDGNCAFPRITIHPTE